MVSYKITMTRGAEKELREISKPDSQRIARRIQTLATNPRPHGSEILKGQDRFFKVRQGDYRILYEINESEKEVILIKIGHRREVYGP